METSSKPDTLIEHVADWHAGLKIDRTNRTVRNVALTGITSKNGYRYSEQALRAATILYQDKPVFLDHALDKSRPHERSTRDLVGTIVDARYEAGRIRGDIRVLDTDSGRTFLALTESDAPGVGMSHVVLAQRDATDGKVDRIHDVVSVDAVVFPATTRTFRESLQGPEDEARSSANVLDATPSQPESDAIANDRLGTDPADSILEQTPESDDTSLHDRLQQLLCERDRLLGELLEIRNDLASKACEFRLAQQLQEAGLPEYAVTDEFQRQLLDANEATQSVLIAERRRLIEAAEQQSPRSIERPVGHPAADVNRVFITAIKRSAF